MNGVTCSGIPKLPVMTVSRNRFFAFLVLLLLPFFIPRLIWLERSRPVTGSVSFTGKDQAGQFMHTYAVVRFRVNDSLYWFNGPDNMLYPEGTLIPVLYQPTHPSDARIHSFLSVWGDLLVYTGIPFLLLLILFIHPEIIPWKKKIRIQAASPWFAVVD